MKKISEHRGEARKAAKKRVRRKRERERVGGEKEGEEKERERERVGGEGAWIALSFLEAALVVMAMHIGG